MSRIAPEIDELMWTIAQQRDPQAIDEFGQRFPELRQELGKRLALTESLRIASAAGRPRSIPRFTPRQAPTVWWMRPAGLVAMGAILTALAVGSFSVTRMLAKPELVPVADTTPVSPPNSVGPDSPQPVNPDPRYKINEHQENNGEQPVQNPGGTSTQPKPEQLPAYLQPKTLDVPSARFPVVLDLIAQACGLEITMPDMPADLADMEIEVHYSNKSGLEMLADMGSKYGFTAFHQGGNKVLIVPAREDSASTGSEHP